MVVLGHTRNGLARQQEVVDRLRMPTLQGISDTVCIYNFPLSLRPAASLYVNVAMCAIFLLSLWPSASLQCCYC